MVRAGCRIRSPCQGRSASRSSWVTRWSREAEAGHDAGRPCQHGLPNYIEPGIGRPAPLAIELTLAETECQEDTAREPLNGRR